jgi:hypothetical protein
MGSSQPSETLWKGFKKSITLYETLEVFKMRMAWNLGRLSALFLPAQH